MQFLFKDRSFSFEALRAAGFANYGGADLSDILVTARTIKDGDEASWLRSWKATAKRVHAVADQALAQDHRVSAREAFLRASNYYRTAEFFQRVNPAEDPEIALLSGLSRKTFRAAMKLLDSPVEEVSIPYGGSTLPGYLFLVDASGRPRPTIIYNNGFDSTSEESYFAIAAAALLRGYNVVAFDGPGQGAALRVQRLVFRHDWEAVVTPVIDFALMRPEILPESLVLFGYSFGGYLVARAAAFDHRPAAIILDDGLFDYSVSGSRAMPKFLFRWIMEGRDSLATPLLRAAAAVSTQSRWGMNNGVWAMGAASMPDYVRRTTKYTLAGVAEKITCPTLILDADNDQFFRGEPQRVRAALKAPCTLITLTDAEGAGEHCHYGATSRAHQQMFDWLDAMLAPQKRA